jgi:ABC-type transport system involved in multi-copper enzyme maturation permease subunit
MIAEGIRMKVAIIFIVMLAIIVPAMPAIMQGDGTLKGRVQTFLAYSLGATMVLLGMLTLFLSCASVAGEIRSRSIFTVVTKPIARWQFLLGKWLGIVMLDGLLLAGMAVAVYGMVAYLKTTSWLNETDRAALRYEVLTARASVRPVTPNFDQLADARIEQLRKEGRLPTVYRSPDGRLSTAGEDLREQIIDELNYQWWACPPRGSKAFLFKDVRPGEKRRDFIHLRYKAQVSRFPPTETLLFWWEVGDPAKAEISEPYRRPRKDVVGRYHVVPFPADAIAEDGTLLVRFVNRDPEKPWPPEATFATSVNFSEQGDLEVLYEVDSFEANYLRSLLMIMTQLMLLAGVGVLASSFLSFPVASLLCIMIYVIALASGFLEDAVRMVDATLAMNENSLPLKLAALLKPATVVFLKIMPHFALYNPIGDMVDGRLVSWHWLGRAFIWLGGLQTALALACACVVFRRRELAQVVV